MQQRPISATFWFHREKRRRSPITAKLPPIQLLHSKAVLKNARQQ